MHCLEVLIYRNDYAAGRAEGHASNDKDHELHLRLYRMNPEPTSNGYIDGYMAGRKEG